MNYGLVMITVNQKRIIFNWWHKDTDMINPVHINTLERITKPKVKSLIHRGFFSGDITADVEGEHYEGHWYYGK